jgi:hydroxypyruvate isomerase
MSSFKQCTTWWPISKVLDEPGALDKIKEIGFEGVELVPRDKFDMAREAGLSIATFGGHKSLQDGLNKRENHQRIADELRANFEVARQYGIPNLIVFSGNRNGLDDEKGAEITAEGLSLVAPDAEKAGITLVMELLNSKVNHPDYQCDHTAWGVQVVKAVGSPRVKLLYDIYHMQIMEGDLIRTIGDHKDVFAHYHTGGVPGRHELDATQEVNWAAVCKAIVDSGFRGYLAHEFVPTRDPLTSLREAVVLCDV